MKNQLALVVLLVSLTTAAAAQKDTAQSGYLKPKPRNYAVKQAIEV
jgi:hypothetical protein